MINKAISLIILTAMVFVFSNNNGFTADSDLKDFIGKKICREAQGPDDTTSFKITLLKNGIIKGNGSYTGASANFTLSSGTWTLQNDTIEIILIFSGTKYGAKKGEGSQKFSVKILKSDFINNKSECFEFTESLYTIF